MDFMFVLCFEYLDVVRILKVVPVIDVTMDSSISPIVNRVVAASKEHYRKYVINKTKDVSVKSMFKRVGHVIDVLMVHTIYKVQIQKDVRNASVLVKRHVANAHICDHSM